MKFDDLNGAILIIYTTIDLGGALMEHEKMSWNILEAGIFVGWVLLSLGYAQE